MPDFIETSPTTDAYWRSIVLFGKNSASYKFALGKSLLEAADQRKTSVSLEELAEPYARNLVEHLQKADRQGTSPSSTFLEVCRRFSRGEIAKDELFSQTARLGFVNVIDAFHNVNHIEIPVRFFVDERATRGAINLTDELLALKENFQYGNLRNEIEARWRLVETAWSLDVSPRLLVARYDPSADGIYVEPSGARRIDVTSCRDALNGYQKGRCFYCSSDISVEAGHEDFCDVDHFFPHTLGRFLPTDKANLDGVWNLVLSCRRCNRGKQGKSARVPAIRFLEKLHRRNKYLIGSHHPLRETLMTQTGRTESERRSFLQEMESFAIQHLASRWEPSDELRPVI
jgi:hypothetical protein